MIQDAAEVGCRCEARRQASAGSIARVYELKIERDVGGRIINDDDHARALVRWDIIVSAVVAVIEVSKRDQIAGHKIAADESGIVQ